MRTWILLLALGLAAALVPAASAIPPCFENGASVTVHSDTLGLHERAQDPLCYTHGIPWWTLRDMGVPLDHEVVLP